VVFVLSLVILWESTCQEVEHTWPLHIEAAKEMARAGAYLLVLGDNPINLAEEFNQVRIS
jgi:hypothetical protein